MYWYVTELDPNGVEITWHAHHTYAMACQEAVEIERTTGHVAIVHLDW